MIDEMRRFTAALGAVSVMERVESPVAGSTRSTISSPTSIHPQIDHGGLEIWRIDSDILTAIEFVAADEGG